MPAYTNNLRLREITTGDESGTWGDTTNSNLGLIADAFGSGTEGLSGTSHTTTIANSTTASEGRAIYMKYTGALGANNTILLAPNTVNKLWIIENATTDSGSSGPYSIIISQGTGDTVTIPNGKVAVVYADGAGSAADVKEAFANLKIGPSLTVGNAAAEDTKVVFDGHAQDYYVGLDDTDDDLKIGLGSTVGTTPAITIDENQNTTISQDLTVSGVGPHAIGGALADYVAFRRLGSFTSGGSSDFAALNSFEGALTGASGDTWGLFGSAFQSSVTTQGSDTIATVAQVLIKEPVITVGSGATVTNSAALYIYSAATEATNDYALWVDSGSARFDGDLSVAATQKIYLDGGGNSYITESAGDTVKIYTGGTEAVEVTSAQNWKFNGYITVPAGDKVYLDGGSDVYIEQGTTDRFDVVAGGVTGFHVAESGSAPHGIEVKSYGNLAIAGITEQTGSYTSQATSDNEACMTVSSTMTGHANNTGHLTGLYVNNAFVVPASTTVGLIAQMRLNTPGINLSATGAAVTNTATFYIEGPPSGGGTNNYAGLIDSGAFCIDANFLVGARTAGANGYGANTAAYLRTSTATFNTLTLDHNVSVPSGAPSVLMTTAAGNTSQSYYHIRCVTDRDDSDSTVFYVNEDGTVSKTGGSFRIDHPLPEKKDTHDLYHSFIEGPRADLNYRGTAELSGGWAQVDLDESADMTAGTWELLCRDPQCWIQNDSGWSAVRGSVEGSVLTIECADSDSSDSVSWLVVAERCDEYMMNTKWTDETGKVIVEQEKRYDPISGPAPDLDVDP